MGLGFTPTRTVRVAPGALGASMGTAGVTGKPVKVLPGQAVHFTPGKGTHAGPDTTNDTTVYTDSSPSAPPDGPDYSNLMTANDIRTAAGQTASQEVAGQVLPFQSDLAQTAAAGDVQAKQAGAFSSATGKLLGSIGPSIQAGYDTAANEVKGLAKGIEGPVQQQLGSTQDANAALSAQWGADPSQGPQRVDPTALGNTIYMGGGFIPSNQLITNAFAQNQWAQGLKGVQAAQGAADQEGIASATQAAEGKINDKIAQVVAKYPQYFSAEEKTLLSQNIKTGQLDVSAFAQAVNAYKAQDAAAYHLGQLTHLSNVDSVAAAKIDETIRDHKVSARLKLDGINATISYHNGELKIQGDRAATAWLNAQVKANGISYGASKASGVLMDNAGNVIKGKDGKPIPIDARVYATAAGKRLTSTQIKNSPAGRRAAAQAWIVKEYSKPVMAPKDLQFFGQYVLDPHNLDAQGKGDPSRGDKLAGGHWYTSDITRAQRGSNLPFASAVKTVATQFRISRKEARALLRQEGIKPDGVRPAPSPSDAIGSVFPPGVLPPPGGYPKP